MARKSCLEQTCLFVDSSRMHQRAVVLVVEFLNFRNNDKGVPECLNSRIDARSIKTEMSLQFSCDAQQNRSRAREVHRHQPRISSFDGRTVFVGLRVESKVHANIEQTLTSGMC